MKLGELAALLNDHLAEHPDDVNREVLVHISNDREQKVSPIVPQKRAYFEFKDFDPLRVELEVSRVPGAMGGSLTGLVSDLNGLSS